MCCLVIFVERISTGFMRGMNKRPKTVLVLSCVLKVDHMTNSTYVHKHHSGAEAISRSIFSALRGTTWMEPRLKLGLKFELLVLKGSPIAQLCPKV